MSDSVRVFADALGCFHNAAFGRAIESQDSTVIATVGAIVEGFAAVEARLTQVDEICQVTSPQAATFTFYPGDELTIVGRNGSMMLLENKAGNRMWKHESFVTK